MSNYFDHLLILLLLLLTFRAVTDLIENFTFPIPATLTSFPVSDICQQHTDTSVTAAIYNSLPLSLERYAGDCNDILLRVCCDREFTEFTDASMPSQTILA